MKAPYFPDIKIPTSNKISRQTRHDQIYSTNKTTISFKNGYKTSETPRINGDALTTPRMANSNSYNSQGNTDMWNDITSNTNVMAAFKNDIRPLTVIGKLQTLTMSREKTLCSVLDKTLTNKNVTTKDVKMPKLERLSIKPLQHCLSESQLLTPGRMTERSNWSKSLKRFNSEAKLLKSSSNNKLSPATLRANRLSVNNNIGNLRRYNSTIALNSSEKSTSECTSSSKNTERVDKNSDFITERIQNWLIGADDADDPPEQEIAQDDNPRQTDTAVHIIYTGD